MFGEPEGEANLPDAEEAKPDRAKRGMVSLTFASWNPLTSWLRQVERLRHAA